MTRFGYVMTTYFAVLAIGGLSFVHIAPTLVWNASASTPTGLYRIRPAGRLAVGDLVVVDAPEPLASFLADGYLPRGVLLMKRVTGLPGQQVCRNGLAITVDGIEIGKALEHDRLSRPLPIWKGCRRIAIGEVFLMNVDVHDSLDGRYFGPIQTRSIIGRATPLWTDEDGTGRYEWRAQMGEDGHGPDVGAGWQRTGDKAGEYVSLLIDDPVFAQPIRANLFRSDADNASWSLHWNRPPKRSERE